MTTPTLSAAARRAAQALFDAGYAVTDSTFRLDPAAAIIERELRPLVKLLRDALPYVERAYDYSFPDLAENSRIAGDIRAALGETDA